MSYFDQIVKACLLIVLSSLADNLPLSGKFEISRRKNFYGVRPQKHDLHLLTAIQQAINYEPAFLTIKSSLPNLA